MRVFILTFVLVASSVHAFADGLNDNDPANVRPVPPPGVEVPQQIRRSLESELAELELALRELRGETDASLLPDIEIFSRAVRSALDHNEFFSEREFEHARLLLEEGKARAKKLQQGSPDWTTKTGLVVRGYRSKIDHSPQPFGLVIPANKPTKPWRLDVWFHGRGERTSEVGFIHERTKQIGYYAPADTIVLHPYGRYSNAFKFAGETDVLEAIEATRRHYDIDPDRISVRGFSMGGAACWQFAVHYADRWFAANPGAGFSETPEFLRFFQNETLNPTWYERKLWQWYDCNGYAMNLLHCPTIAYSGELDIQKQAADVMEVALAKEGIDLVHIVGPQTKHSIHDDSQVEIERRMNQLARWGRDRMPRAIDFRTYTLKYNRMHWVTVDALEQHWEPATVKARLAEDRLLSIVTENVAALSIDFPAGTFQDVRTPIALVVDDVELLSRRPGSDRSWRLSIVKKEDRWIIGRLDEPGLHKKHDLQGPIDDAFMDSFIFVQPTGSSVNAKVDEWVKAELQHAIAHWRLQFRGEARVKRDEDITAEDIATAHLVLFGTPQSNSLLGRIAKDLPIAWGETNIVAGNDRFAASHHVPLLVYPNPLQPERYVVLNSGFTYREFAYLNNARQVPMLPDWAIVDVRTPPTSQYPGKVVAANFFDEQWRLKEGSGDAINTGTQKE